MTAMRTVAAPLTGESSRGPGPGPGETILSTECDRGCLLLLVLVAASCRWSQSLPSPDSGLRARLSWLASPSSLVGQWMGGGDLVTGDCRY